MQGAELVTLLGENNPSQTIGLITLAAIVGGVWLLKSKQGKRILKKILPKVKR